ncbi:hypothetical protein GCM10023231_42690 [Olivibacter ginsenosidimutans]|uniref:WD40-like Beta Propeller Repeat n=1 Tax=Olivibacter ginsenosidimutans TaxID=1176537 RepID=A0ABP9CDL1_9SPHI
MKRKQLLWTVVAMMMLNACSKSNPDEVNPDNGHYGSGNIFIKQGTEGITKFDLTTGILSSVIPNWLSAGWDISWDGKKGVKEVNESSYDTRYIFFNTADGSTIKELFYEPNDNNGGLPYISPDGSKLALRPTLRDGLVILDVNTGHVLRNISGYGNTHEFEYLDPICWEPGGTILFKKDGGLWRTSNDFGRATKVRDIPFSDWRGYADASPDGKKIVVPAGNHIWLMNADGSDFHAVTESNQDEFSPCFSPDSKYIAMKANARAPEIAGSSDNAYHLCIIPADGEVYKVYPGEDKRVIHPRARGDEDSRGLGMTIVGDFVWRQ